MHPIRITPGHLHKSISINSYLHVLMLVTLSFKTRLRTEADQVLNEVSCAKGSLPAALGRRGICRGLEHEPGGPGGKTAHSQPSSESSDFGARVENAGDMVDMFVRIKLGNQMHSIECYWPFAESTGNTGTFTFSLPCVSGV